MLRAFLIIIFSFFCCNSYGQEKFKFGVTGGLGVSILHTYESFVHVEESRGSIFSYCLGVKGEYGFLNNFLFHPEVRFSSKGLLNERSARGSIPHTSTTYRANYLEVPLELSVDFGKKDGFILTGGGYVAVGLFGTKTIKYDGEVNSKTPIEFSRYDYYYNYVPILPDYVIYEDQLVLRPFEFGWTIGIGYRKNRVLIDLKLNQSIGSNHPHNETMYYQTVRLGFTYFIWDLF